MQMTIDGVQIETLTGKSVLKAALDAGIYIPHLCSHPDLESKGGCRLCSVEIEGIEGAVPACMTKVQEGMVVRVNGDMANRVRNTAMELLLATHVPDCTGCSKYGKCEMQSTYQFLGVSSERWRRGARGCPEDENNPLISHNFSYCIRCGRCVRACQDLRGIGVLDYIETASGVHAGVPDGKSLAEAGCRFCGACVEVCPTGSILDAFGMVQEGVSREDSIVPCRAACPARIDIPRFIRHNARGDFTGAASVIREKVPFPESLGRVCEHACESDCKRGQLNEPISICREKRAAEAYGSGGWKTEVNHLRLSGKSVAVVGAGPAGLTASYYLAGKGHAVTVFEANKKAGGQLRYGIPAYRLPDATVEREVSDILESAGSGAGDLGDASRIQVRYGERIERPGDLLQQGFDAVLLALGTHEGTVLPMKGADLNGVYVNTAFLKAVREGHPMNVSGSVVVLGGGNVAYDCARTAIRLGAEQVHVACRKARTAMTANADEIEEGREEGVVLHDGYGFDEIVESPAHPGRVGSVRIRKISGFRFDKSHRALAEYVKGGDLEIPADHVIFAVGQKPQGIAGMGVELVHGSYIAVGKSLSTSMPGIFAAGDCVTGTKTVIEAIVQGRAAAESIDRWLGGDGDISEHLANEEILDPLIGRRPNFAEEHRAMPHVEGADARKRNFYEYETALSAEWACSEAQRCLQCDLRLSITKPKLWNEFKEEHGGVSA